MSCNHERIRELSQSDRRDRALMGNDTVTCDDCGKEFKIRLDAYQGTFLLVASELD